MRLPTTTLKRVADQVSCGLDEEVAVLHLGSGRYFGMETTALFLWELLGSPHSSDSLTTAVVAQYEVSHDVARKDVETFVTALVEAGLVEPVTS
jgi:hypothetical protein